MEAKAEDKKGKKRLVCKDCDRKIESEEGENTQRRGSREWSGVTDRYRNLAENRQTKTERESPTKYSTKEADNEKRYEERK